MALLQNGEPSVEDDEISSPVVDPMEGELVPPTESDPRIGYGTTEEAKTLLPQEARAIEATSSGVCNSLLWFTYDASESFWMTVVNSIAFSPYALLLGLLHGWRYNMAMSMCLLWVSAANTLIAILSPFVGALTDVLGMRKWVVVFLACGGVAGTAALPAIKNFHWACAMFGLAWTCIHLCRLLYDAQIPFVFGTRRRGLVQALGSALSVIGAITAIVSSIVVKKIWGSWLTISTDAALHLSEMSSDYDPFGALPNFMWLAAGVFVAFFVSYLFHSERIVPRNEPLGASIRRTGTELRMTFFDIFRDKNGVYFTIAWMIVVSSAGCNQSLSPTSLQGAVGINAFLTDVCVAISLPFLFIGAICSGFVLHRYGGRVSLLYSLFFFVVSEICIVFAGWEIGGKSLPKWPVYVNAVGNGLGNGFMLTCGRQMMMELSAPSRVAQWGAFQKICGRIGLVINPIIYAVVFVLATTYGVSVNMSYRIINFIRLGIYAIGVVFAWLIVDPHPRYMAGERAPFDKLYEPGGRYPRHVQFREDDR